MNCFGHNLAHIWLFDRVDIARILFTSKLRSNIRIKNSRSLWNYLNNTDQS
nr:hypothetical protein PHYPA_017352 [Physcomitrium patens]